LPRESYVSLRWAGKPIELLSCVKSTINPLADRFSAVPIEQLVDNSVFNVSMMTTTTTILWGMTDKTL
jgi:hypothetical protein